MSIISLLNQLDIPPLVIGGDDCELRGEEVRTVDFARLKRCSFQYIIFSLQMREQRSIMCNLKSDFFFLLLAIVHNELLRSVMKMA